MRALLLCLALALAGCTKITEITEIDCELLEFFPHGTTAERADSAVYRNCDQPAYEGMVVRFK